MIANIVVIVFVLAMIFWWSQQGFFSAFIHLCLTIVAGTIALSIWEPLVLKFLIFRMPQYAWTVGLLAPFALLLFGLRFAADRLVPGNVQMMPLLSKALGGACGLGSGVLTAGLVFIGLGVPAVGPVGAGAGISPTPRPTGASPPPDSDCGSALTPWRAAFSRLSPAGRCTPGAASRWGCIGPT